MKEIGTDEVAEGLFELFKQRPELRLGDATMLEDQEAAAIALILSAVRGDWSGWTTAAPEAVATARGLTSDFFIKVMHPRPGEFLGKRWFVAPASLAEMALAVIGQEIEGSHPGQTRPH